jgi:hypothetical protein
MKYLDGNGALPIMELTRRNLETLLRKLDDPLSARGLIDPDDRILVRAVETIDERGTSARQAAAATEGVIELARVELQTLLAGLESPDTREGTVIVYGVTIRAVTNDAHYRGRAPGVVWMPSTGELM